MHATKHQEWRCMAIFAMICMGVMTVCILFTTATVIAGYVKYASIEQMWRQKKMGERLEHALTMLDLMSPDPLGFMFGRMDNRTQQAVLQARDMFLQANSEGVMTELAELFRKMQRFMSKIGGP